MTMKRALVTGGSGDLGKAICIDLAKNNIEVV
jgi:NAD(P)-dependent dehydrogenase (short-subunit alcohol dehydrogenase family)